MKNFSFYWHWLARVAKSNNAQRNAVVKSAASQPPIRGTTAILAIAVIITALTTQTTGPSMQSAELPEIPDLPDPGPVPEPAFPPVPPSTFTCSEYFASVRPMLNDQDVNLKKAIERTYNAKCKPFYDAKDKILDEWDEILAQVKKLNEEWNRLYMSPNNRSAANITRRRQINKELAAQTLRFLELQEKLDTINERLGEISGWREKMLEWAKKKHEKAVDALEKLTRDCLANERDDD